MLNKNDPLIGAVQEVMKRNQAEREAAKLVNEKFGVTDRKALPHERQGEWDAAYKTVLTEGVEALDEKVKMSKGDIAALRHPKKKITSHDFAALRAGEHKMEEDVTSPSSMGIKGPDYATGTPAYANKGPQMVNRAAKTSLPAGTVAKSIKEEEQIDEAGMMPRGTIAKKLLAMKAVRKSKQAEKRAYDDRGMMGPGPNFEKDVDTMQRMKKVQTRLQKEETLEERKMTSTEKTKEEKLKSKLDTSGMKASMKKQYGKEKGEKVYFATIRKKAMKEDNEGFNDRHDSSVTASDENQVVAAQLNERSPGTARKWMEKNPTQGETLGNAALSVIPGMSAIKKAKEGDYKGAAKSAAIDATLTAVGGPVAKSLVKGYRWLRGGAKAADAVSDASKAVPKSTAPVSPRPAANKPNFNRRVSGEKPDNAISRAIDNANAAAEKAKKAKEAQYASQSPVTRTQAPPSNPIAKAINTAEKRAARIKAMSRPAKDVKPGDARSDALARATGQTPAPRPAADMTTGGARAKFLDRARSQVTPPNPTSGVPQVARTPGNKTGISKSEKVGPWNKIGPNAPARPTSPNAAAGNAARLAASQRLAATAGKVANVVRNNPKLAAGAAAGAALGGFAATKLANQPQQTQAGTTSPTVKARQQLAAVGNQTGGVNKITSAAPPVAKPAAPQKPVATKPAAQPVRKAAPQASSTPAQRAQFNRRIDRGIAAPGTQYKGLGVKTGTKVVQKAAPQVKSPVGTGRVK